MDEYRAICANTAHSPQRGTLVTVGAPQRTSTVRGSHTAHPGLHPGSDPAARVEEPSLPHPPPPAAGTSSFSNSRGLSWAEDTPGRSIVEAASATAPQRGRCPSDGGVMFDRSGVEFPRVAYSRRPRASRCATRQLRRELATSTLVAPVAARNAT